MRTWLCLVIMVSIFTVFVLPVYPESQPWIDGTALLRERSVKLARDNGWGEKMVPEARILKNEAVSPPELGDSRTFWVFAFEPFETLSGETVSGYYQLEATLQAIGDNSYIYVEKDNVTKVSAKAIEGLKEGFDKQIYPTNTKVFGDPPDVDGDSHIFILVLDIKDGFSGSGQPFVAGYYDSSNQYPNGSKLETEILKNSNEADMFYVDMNPADPDSIQTLGTIAHEFEHMIHWNQDPFEDVWLDEGLADLAIYLNGYSHPESHVDSFLRAPETSLSDSFGQGLNEYGAAYLFSLYLWEKYGGDATIKKLVSNESVGKEGIEETLASPDIAISETFADIFHDWKVANYLNDVSTDKRYGYTSIDLDNYSDLKIVDSRGIGGTGSVNGWGSEYLRFVGSAEIVLETDMTLNVRAISEFSSVSELVWEGGRSSVNVGSGETVLALNPDDSSVSSGGRANQSSYSYTVETKGDNPSNQTSGDIFGLFGCGSGSLGPLALGWIGLWGWRRMRRAVKW